MNAPRDLDTLIKEQKIIITCGSGGVGKTSTAAALGVRAAFCGRKTLVLTVDPAKRLAASMGLKSLSNQAARIEPSLFPSPPSADLYAMMLDAKGTFDRVIERYAPSESAKKSIFENRLYQEMSTMMAGSQEYMAMERLHEIYHEGTYDLIILDTPPTRNALNFLEAPQKMADMTHHSILKWFLKPSLFASRIGLGIFRRSTSRVLRIFDQLAGFNFLQELAEMLQTMAEMIGGFGDRAERVNQLLRAPEVSLILVTSPEKIALQDARYFYQEVAQFKLPIAGLVFNRVYPQFLTSPCSVDAVCKQVEELPRSMAEALYDNLIKFDTLHAIHAKNIKEFLALCGSEVFYREVPYFSQDIHDLTGLTEMSSYLGAKSGTKCL